MIPGRPRVYAWCVESSGAFFHRFHLYDDKSTSQKDPARGEKFALYIFPSFQIRPDLRAGLNRFVWRRMRMTPILKPIAESFRITNFILELCLADLKETDAKKRVRKGEGPSIAWQVGHMLDHRCKVLGLARR